MSKQIYAEVTKKIVEQLEKGVAPWVRPWSTSSVKGHVRGRMFPHNVQSNRDYRGINVILLVLAAQCKGYAPGAWATYKQIGDRGGQVRKGEKATQVVFFSAIEVEDRKNPDLMKKVPLMRFYSVFNVEQAEWTKDPFGKHAPVDGEEAEVDALPDCEETIKATGAVIKHGGDMACYIPSIDQIRMPARKSFVDKGAYYSTTFHELTHWTSKEGRCDRDLSAGRFGNPEYAFEELVAELSSAFLCAEHGVDGTLRHAEYLGHWLKALKDDDTAIFKASALAQKAVTFVMAEQEEAVEA
jgi:antirestriction protein ArdC